MSVMEDPITYSVRVSPELRRLLAGEAHDAVEEPPRSGAPEADLPVPARPSPDSVLRTHHIRLRADGQRPCAFQGALLVSLGSRCSLPDPYQERDTSVEATQIIRLYLRHPEPAGVVGQISLDISGLGFVRPMHSVSEIALPGDLDRFFDSYAPEEVFSVGAALSRDLEAYSAACSRILRREFLRMTTPILSHPAQPSVLEEYQ